MEAFSFESDPGNLVLVYNFARKVIIDSSLNLIDLNVTIIKSAE